MSDTPAIYQAMHRIMSNIGAIGKDSKNQQQGFNFRGIDQVYNSLHQHMVEAGVFTTSEVIASTREERTNLKGTVLAFVTLRVKYTFHSAEDGSAVTTEVQGEGMDSGDKASNKAMAIAHKYALLQAFMIPTEEMKDPDAESHEVVPKVPPKVMARFREIVENDESVALAVFHNTRQTLYVAAHGEYLSGIAHGQKGEVRKRIDAMLKDGQTILSQTLDQMFTALQEGDDARHLWSEMSEAEAEWIAGQIPRDLIELANEGRTAAKAA